MVLVFATQNKNKVKEIKKVIPNFVTLKDLEAIGCSEDIPETKDTIEGNAIQKANFVAEKYQVNCFSDDTGLEVEALNGEPGVYSARYAGPSKNADENMDLLLKKLKNKTNRKARFKTVIALVLDNKTYTFEGIVKGVIRTEKSGDSGFGYDPIFEPEGKGITFAEMDVNEKNTISHRSRAFCKMKDFLEQNFA